MLSTPKLISFIAIVATGLYAMNVMTNDLGWLPLGLLGFPMLMAAFNAAEKMSVQDKASQRVAISGDWGKMGRLLSALTRLSELRIYVMLATLVTFALAGAGSCNAQEGLPSHELEQTAKQSKKGGKSADNLQGTKSTTRPSAAGLNRRMTLTKRHVWGEDMSRTLQGAGGIAGLLVSHSDRQPPNPQPSTTSYFSYDSNGNVILLTSAEAKPTARYAYDAFGKTTKATGPTAQANPYRFSTKPSEAGSGLAFYGYRYYSPEMGRWTARDPIGVTGGINLYLLVRNGSTYRQDRFGLHDTKAECEAECADGAVQDAENNLCQKDLDIFNCNDLLKQCRLSALLNPQRVLAFLSGQYAACLTLATANYVDREEIAGRTARNCYRTCDAIYAQ